MAHEAEWYAIENDFWCPCQDKLASSFYSTDEHLPDCAEFKHRILFKVSDNIEYKSEVLPQRKEEKGRNSVVEEFLANLESLNTSRRRSSSRLLQGFVFNEEMPPSVSTRAPGLEVYLPACFSPTNLEKLAVSLDHDEFQFTGVEKVTQNSTNYTSHVAETDSFWPNEQIDKSNRSDLEQETLVSVDLGLNETTSQKQITSGTSIIQETTEKLCHFSLQENYGTPKQFSTQRNISERLRRSTLNEKFTELRGVISDINNSEKISKINILRKAVECIRKLEQEEKLYSRLKDEEKARNKKLLQKLVEFNKK